MAINVKNLQNIMRKDAGISGDAQRIEQMVWLFFLKVYDAQEEEWEADLDNKYTSIIPEELRWRNWAVDHKDGKALTGEELIKFVDGKLFPGLKKLKVTEATPFKQAVVKEVFSDLNQYMKNGIMLRQLVNEVEENVDFQDAEDRHLFGDVYEKILKDLQGAGHAGEFYTPRALTDFIIERLAPKLGERVADYSAGTGGFLTSALNYLRPQRKTTEDEKLYQKSVYGQEWKPLPYLLCITNLLLHNIEAPQVLHLDSLARPVKSYKDEEKADVIAMNPPYGGSTDSSVLTNFPADMRGSETADLFMVLIMNRLAADGRAGVIVPDGFLFGTEGSKLAIKQYLLRNFNLHTVVRLPGSIFAPYTPIATNLLFFNNERAEGAGDVYKTNKTWFYRLDMPEGYKHFSKTKPMRLEHFDPLRAWWDNRQEIVNDEVGEKSRCFTVQQLMDMDCNLDQCKFPKDEEEVLPPSELLKDYYERRRELAHEIDCSLNKIKELLGLNVEDDERQTIEK